MPSHPWSTASAPPEVSAMADIPWWAWAGGALLLAVAVKQQTEEKRARAKIAKDMAETLARLERQRPAETLARLERQRPLTPPMRRLEDAQSDSSHLDDSSGYRAQLLDEEYPFGE